MDLPHGLWSVAGVIFLMNVPFGFWRARSRKFSGSWFLAIHTPVVLAVGLRILMGIRFMVGTLPVFVGAFFLGQSVGGRLHWPPPRENQAVSDD